MKQLGNTLYVTRENTYLSLDGENIVILQGQQELMRVPLLNLEGVVAFGYTGASPALMGACAKRGVALSFFTQSGRFLARVSGEERGNVVLRKAQYRASDNPAASLIPAKGFLAGKLYNARWILERAARDYPLRLDVVKLRQAAGRIQQGLAQIQETGDLDRLRGLEGEAAQVYFDAFDDLVLQQKGDFFFRGRNRRPPLDNLNALLSFSYTLLAHDCASALEGVGLDPYVGFLHRDRPGRASLALDLMEELRGVVADRFVLSLVNLRRVKPDGFVQKENGSVLMTDETRRNILKHWQERKQEPLTHPFLGEKIVWGLVPHAQALLLARYLRGDLDAYPPFFWK